MTRKIRCLYEVTFNLEIEAYSEEDAEEKAEEFEKMGWRAILKDVDVWGSSIESTGIDESEEEE